MAVMKKKDADWRYYLRELVLNEFKPSDVERQEFAGLLLKNDMESSYNRIPIFQKIISYDNAVVADQLAHTMTNESPDTKEELFALMKAAVQDYYNAEIDKLLESEQKIVDEEKKSALTKFDVEEGSDHE